MIRLVIAPFFLYQVLGSPIVGGYVSDIHFHPWLASIQIDGHHKCVGSIISESVVLTAGHCIKNLTNSYIVRVGSSRTDSGGSWHTVIASKRHNNYSISGGTVLNDIGMLKVLPPFQFNRDVDTIQLAAENQTVAPGTVVTLAGWGSESSSSSAILQLKYTLMLTVDSRDCSKAYGDPTGTKISENNQICAAWNDTDACLGDSGAPLMLDDIQIGIVSTGIGCANPNYPGVYTDVARFRRWIDLNIF